jgi:hypothetical protein
MSAPAEKRRSGELIASDGMASLRGSSAAADSTAIRQPAWQPIDGGGGEFNRWQVYGINLLGAIFLLTVIAAFGMILKSCAEFGSPMVEGPRPEQRSR